MKRHLPFYVLAAAVLIVGVAVGVPTSGLWILGVVVLCPLMMIFMMWGMHGGSGHGAHGDGARGGGDLRQRYGRLGLHTLMTVSMVQFWGLVIYGVIAMVRYLGRQVRSVPGRSPVGPPRSRF